MFKISSFIKLMIACGLIFGLFFLWCRNYRMVQRLQHDNQDGKNAQLERQDGERTNILLGVDVRRR